MATRKGIHISGNYAAPHISHALFIYNNISVKFGAKYRIRSGNSIESDLVGVSLIIDQKTSRSKLTMNRWELILFLYLI